MKTLAFRLRPTILQRYILRELSIVFLLTLAVLTVLMIFGFVLKEILASGLSFRQGIQIIPFVIPAPMPFTIPVTMLLSVCIVYGRMAADQEVTAVKAAGVSAMAVLWPGILGGLALSVMTFVIYDQINPWAVRDIHRTVVQNTERIFFDVLRSNHCLVDPQRGFCVTVVDVDGKTLVQPTFQYTRNGREFTLAAREANLEFQPESQQIVAHLRNGYVETSDRKRIWFEKEALPVPLPPNMTQVKERQMSLSQLRAETDDRRRMAREHLENRDVQIALALGSGQFDTFLEPTIRQADLIENFFESQIRKIPIEQHLRFALSAGAALFALLGAPFSIMQSRREVLSNFFLCFTPILAVYYPVILLTLNLSKMDAVPPWLALWTANLIVASAAAAVLRKVLKH